MLLLWCFLEINGSRSCDRHSYFSRKRRSVFNSLYSRFVRFRMANASYDAMWQQAIGELAEQLHVEGVDMTEEELANGPKDVK